ncbi:MAG: uncharacterized protein QOK04_2001 [Solirubrobacteraceae bacterium]|nr:uncharacterized protein [Solirubrobacteraceae bacterium]
MSRENVELVRGNLERFREGETESAFAHFAPDVEWVVAKEHPESTTHRGTSAIRAYLATWSESVADWELEADEFIDAGDRVAVVGHFRGRGKESGAELSVQVALVSLVREGVVVRVEEYLDRDEALAAAGVK